MGFDKYVDDIFKCACGLMFAQRKGKEGRSKVHHSAAVVCYEAEFLLEYDDLLHLHFCVGKGAGDVEQGKKGSASPPKDQGVSRKCFP